MTASEGLQKSIGNGIVRDQREVQHVNIRWSRGGCRYVLHRTRKQRSVQFLLLDNLARDVLARKDPSQLVGLQTNYSKLFGKSIRRAKN